MNNPIIAVVGSLNMDLVVSTPRLPVLGETIAGHSIHYIPGGKGANQAVGCARLGVRVSMVGAVGTDSFGDQIVNGLLEDGISSDNIVRLPDTPTGTASIFHTPSDNCIVVVPGANGAVTPTLVDRFAPVIQGADLLLVQLEIPLDSVQRALELARTAGVQTVLNPAPAQPLPDHLLQLCDLVTPNESEFELLSGGAAVQSPEQLLAGVLRFQDEHGCRVVVTRGKEGVSYAEGGRLRTVSAPKVEAVDTTGAGDCFNAALGVGLATGWEWERTMSFAVCAASLSVTRFGAQAGMPALEEVEQFRNRLG